MGATWSSADEPVTNDAPIKELSDRLTITGLGSEWPELLVGTDQLREYVESIYPADAAWIQKLLTVSGGTGIKTRAVLECWNDPMWRSPVPPTIEQVHEAFDKYAPPLTAGAARKALQESGIPASAVTHMVSVTATNCKCPGYDHLVAKELGISGDAERSLISGSGCAGGLAALRVANSMACAATLRGRPARILVNACELSSINLRAELEAAHKSGKLRIGAALFSDGAASVVLCNDLALTEKTPRLFTVADWCQNVAADTYDEVSVTTVSQGFLVYLARTLPKHAAAAVHRPLQRLFGHKGLADPKNCDWALHAGGAAIIQGVAQSVGVPDHQLRATSEVYSTRGNTASVTVLAVLDKLRTMGPGTEDVVVCSFGPGLTVEMARLKRHC
ncbi:chalcone synthase B [Astrocystis sublimbata]|nr:chalcone synthase B [Astrocystis sublimbata]